MNERPEPYVSTRAEIQIDASPVVNYAMQQNAVPVIQRLRVKNLSETDLTDLTLELFAEPDFAFSTTLHIDRIHRHATHDLSRDDGLVHLELHPNFLARNAETVRGLLTACLSDASGVVGEKRLPIKLLPYDHWPGVQVLPELLAAFVMPNHRFVESILKRASAIQAQIAHDPSLLGYQSRNPERVLVQARAIYEAIHEQGLSYSTAPASFEETGQKVRTPSRIEEARLANCLDISVLFAACLEQSGLHPLICLMEGHAFPAVWLVERTFPDAATDDAAALKNRVAIGELAIFEATLALTGTHSFETAMAMARKQLEKAGAFLCAVDVKRARNGGIRPLPHRYGSAEEGQPSAVRERTGSNELRDGKPQSAVQGGISPGQRTSSRDGLSGTNPRQLGRSRPSDAPRKTDPSTTMEPSDSPQANGVPCGAPGSKTESPEDRLERWKQRLLDLSLRNRLLNFRETKRTVRIMFRNLADLEAGLGDERTFTIHPRPADWDSSGRDVDIHERRTGEDPAEKLIRTEFEQHRLRADLSEDELRRRLTEIYRAARLSVEESGANTLYLALGFLVWYEHEGARAPQRLAPLLLIPVELKRGSVRAPFSIVRRDEDVVLNQTLYEKLRRDFDIQVDALINVDSNRDTATIAEIFEKVRQVIKDVPRWDVREEAYLGLFSFTKFLMWKDLNDRADALRRNKLVNDLIEGAARHAGDAVDFPNPDRLDDEYKPENTFCPLDADSSQLAAIYAAASGKTFVLHGPPGTGKSQTIVNMIAHAMAQGKSVLFVAEKMAALQVVQKRLQENGLGAFSLELHSNKARRKEVLQQFADVLEMAETKEPEEWQREGGRLERLRSELNAYVRAVHKPRDIGPSFFKCISRLLALRDAPQIRFDTRLLRNANSDSLDEWREIVRDLVHSGRAVGHPKNHLWSAARVTDWSPSLRDGVQDSIDRLLALIPQVMNLAERTARLFALQAAGWNERDLEALRQLASFMRSKVYPLPALIESPDPQDAFNKIHAWVHEGRARDQLRRSLYDRYTDRLMQLDLDALDQSLSQASKTWFGPRWLMKRRVANILATAARPGRELDLDSAAMDIKSAKRLRTVEAYIQNVGTEARTLLGSLWNNGEADWDAVEGAVEWASRVVRMAERLGGADPYERNRLKARWAQLFAHQAEEFAEGGAHAALLNDFLHAVEAMQTEVADLTRKLDLDPAVWGEKDEPDYLSRLQDTLSRWRERINELQRWAVWRQNRSKAVAAGLEFIVREYEAGSAHDDVWPAFERAYYTYAADQIMTDDPILSRFTREAHEERIREFRHLDDKLQQLSQAVIRARVLSRVPTAGQASPNSELGILQRQLRLKRPSLSIRSLFQRIPHALRRLKPCLLMSPLSVAQYLDPDFPPFDLVIFDEASQIPTWDAVGAIARGDQCIIVGDAQQLPPTTFFERMSTTEDEEADYEIEDLESILDECEALQLPQLRLLWHYRSRNEALIAFSNQEYYGNDLVTFPSSERVPAVKLRLVNGIYDRGRSNTNRIEAEAVVEEIRRRLLHHGATGSRVPSIGVVTFNQSQQRLIEDLIDELRQSEPAIEPYFSSDHPEPVFIKNLENVQGDERDIILISLAYGPDSSGRVTMNFGPLNRDGGHRRLNVAITRAREEIVVFSSLTPEQIDAGRARYRGVKDLKYYLEYARDGFEVLGRRLKLGEDGEPESPFEEDVANVLRDHGYTVVSQVGASSYRIDLGVVDPDNPGRFLLGIECDGAMYHSAKTARDRDKLREAALRKLGWRLHRIWSTDWWYHRESEIERLLTAVEHARQPVDDPPVEPKPPEREDGTPSAGEPVLVQASVIPQTPKPQPELPVYRPSTISPDPRAIYESFYSPTVNRHLKTMIHTIVLAEGPISLASLTRRLTAHWGMGRATERARARILKLAKTIAVERRSRDGRIFLWPRGVDPDTYDVVRIHEEDHRRDAADLPPEEVAAAMLHVLRSQVSLPKDDLINETARLFGYARTGSQVRDSILAGYEILEQRNSIKESNGMVVEVE